MFRLIRPPGNQGKLIADRLTPQPHGLRSVSGGLTSASTNAHATGAASAYRWQELTLKNLL